MFSHQLFPFEEMLRYSRHIILPEVGPLGQEKLRNAKVLIVGAGGLGSPVALYLAAAGIGNIGLIDFDRVELSNLQRQVIHTNGRIGEHKVASAALAIGALNPHVRVEQMPFAITKENVLEIIGRYDIVVDGTDNFATRYLVNDGCVLLKKPYVYGSIYRFEGHVSVFGIEGKPCYRCLFPTPPSQNQAPSCSEAGVLGVLAGTIGTLQATEVLKLILGIGESLAGSLLTYDALGMQVRKLKASANPACAVCAKDSRVLPLGAQALVCADELDASCAILSAEDFLAWKKEKKSFVILDIRTPQQRYLGGLEGALTHTLEEMDEAIKNLDSASPCVVVCQLGVRSKEAIRRLKELGYKGELLNLRGGILGLAQALV